MKPEVKRIITAICMVCLMLIDVKAGNDSWYIWLITNNFVGVVIAFIMFSAYPFKEFVRPFYIIWSILGVLGEIGAYVFWYTHQVGHIMGFWITVPINIWALGMVFFKYVEKIFITKEMKIRFAKWEYVFIACMLLMLFSKSDYIWPVYFLIIFLMLWHSPFSSDDKTVLFRGILDGILAGFIVLQGKAFLFKNYGLVRYTGAYWNSNRNGALYLLVMTMFMARILLLKKERESVAGSDEQPERTIKKLNLRIIANLIMTSVMSAFIMYTGSRTSLIGMVLITVFYYLFGERRIAKNKIGNITKQFLIYVVSFVIAVPLIYFPICYLPLIRQAVRTEIKNLVKGTDIPISISNEGSVKLDEALDNMVLRYLRSDIKADDREDILETDLTTEAESDVEQIEDEVIASEETPYVFALESYPDDGMNYVVEYYFTSYPERGKGVFFVPRKWYSGITSLNVRLNMYFALIYNMNLSGHDSSEVFMVLSSTAPGEKVTWVNNEQNFIIHYFYDYGVPIGSLFCILIIVSLIYLIRMSLKGKAESFAFAMFYLVFILTGLMEVVWIPGQFVFVILFFAPLFYEKTDRDSIPMM